MEEKNPLVSVVMPVYNQKLEYLQEAIDSIIKQTYKNWELIIVDDGSDEDPFDKFHSDILSNEKIILLIQENKGVAGALNTGIKNMKGEWFAWLSSDDVWYPEKLQKQLEFIINNPNSKIIYSDWEYIDESGKHIKYEVEPVFNDPSEVRFHLCHRFFGCGSTILIHKDCIAKVGTFNEKYRGMEDYELWGRLSKEYMFYKVPLCLMKYRSHPNALRYSFPNFGGVFHEIRDKNREILQYDKVKISAVILGKNVQDTIVKCIYRIKEHPQVDEIIVINDGSTDKTQQRLEGLVMPMSSQNITFEVIKNQTSVGRGIARNIGMKKAKNPLIVTVDGDIIPEPGFINRLMKVMDGDSFLDIVAGSLRWKSINIGLWAEYYDFYITQTAKRQIGTALTLFKKSALERVGFLDETLPSGEDSELFFRLQKAGIKFAKIPDLLGTHIEDRNLFEILARHYQYGMDRFNLYQRHKDQMQGQFKPEELTINPPDVVNLFQQLLSNVGSLGFRDAIHHGHLSLRLTKNQNGGG